MGTKRKKNTPWDTIKRVNPSGADLASNGPRPTLERIRLPDEVTPQQYLSIEPSQGAFPSGGQLRYVPAWANVFGVSPFSKLMTLTVPLIPWRRIYHCLRGCKVRRRDRPSGGPMDARGSLRIGRSVRPGVCVTSTLGPAGFLVRGRRVPPSSWTSVARAADSFDDRIPSVPSVTRTA